MERFFSDSVSVESILGSDMWGLDSSLWEQRGGIMKRKEFEIMVL